MGDLWLSLFYCEGVQCIRVLRAEAKPSAENADSVELPAWVPTLADVRHFLAWPHLSGVFLSQKQQRVLGFSSLSTLQGYGQRSLTNT